jgi:hypothetical protein
MRLNQPAISDDLCKVIHAWDGLSSAVKAGILAMVKAVPDR